MKYRERPRSSTTKRPSGRGERGGRPTGRPPKDCIKMYGVQACLTLFERRKEAIERVFVHPALEERFTSVIRWCSRRGLPVKIVEFEELSIVAGTEHHEGVCVEAPPPRVLSLSELVNRLSDIQRGCLLVLEGVENPHNVGAILRTACFFGVSAVVLRSQQIRSLSGAACRVSEGAAEILPIAITHEYGSLFNALKERGFSVIATTPHDARSIYGVKWPSKVVLMFGAEGPGLSEEVMSLADMRVVIPRLGPLESLNVSVAVGAVLTEARRELVVSGAIRRHSG